MLRSMTFPSKLADPYATHILEVIQDILTHLQSFRSHHTHTPAETANSTVSPQDNIKRKGVEVGMETVKSKLEALIAYMREAESVT